MAIKYGLLEFGNMYQPLNHIIPCHNPIPLEVVPIIRLAFGLVAKIFLYCYNQYRNPSELIHFNANYGYTVEAL